MKANQDRQEGGFTLIEAMIVIAVLAVLVAMLLPIMAKPCSRSPRINCVNNLKQVGLSFRQWALDHNDKFPMNVSFAKGGAMECAQQGIAWPVFQVMSNELNIPKILTCPADTSRTNAPDFKRNLNNWELGYFVGLDAGETQPQMFLTGDSDLGIGPARFRSGIVNLNTNRLINFSEDRHGKQGNIGLADGSVQGYSNSRLRQALTETGDLANRIIIP